MFCISLKPLCKLTDNFIFYIVLKQGSVTKLLEPPVIRALRKMVMALQYKSGLLIRPLSIYHSSKLKVAIATIHCIQGRIFTKFISWFHYHFFCQAKRSKFLAFFSLFFDKIDKKVLKD